MFSFQAALREPSVKGVIINLSGVPYMDSAALGVLLGHWSHTQRLGYKYALVGLSARVHTIFEITHTDGVLPIFPTQADAEKTSMLPCLRGACGPRTVMKISIDGRPESPR